LWNEDGNVEIHNFTKVFNELENENSDKIRNKTSGKPFFT